MVRRGYELFNRGDFDRLLELLAPECEFDLSTLYPDAPIFRGSAEILSFRDSGPWGHSVHLEPERIFDVDAERVLVFVRVTATGQGSGVPVEMRDAHEFTIREGLVARCKVHPDRDAALESVGIKE